MRWTTPTWVAAEVGVQKLLVVAVDGPCHGWPGRPETEVTGDIVLSQLITLGERCRRYSLVPRPPPIFIFRLHSQ